MLDLISSKITQNINKNIRGDKRWKNSIDVLNWRKHQMKGLQYDYYAGNYVLGTNKMKIKNKLQMDGSGERETLER